MNIYRYTKDNLLYLLAENRQHYYGRLTAIPYNRRFDREFIVNGKKDRKRFILVSHRG